MTNLVNSIAGFAVAALGLTIPGYALARALRLKSCLAAAFPFSAFLLCQAVVLLACLEWRISFAAVATILITISALFAFIARLGKSSAIPETGHSERDSGSDPLLLKISVTAALLLVAAVAFRTTLYPLGGFDTFTRWDALARAMLQYGSLSFYPPVTPNDFAIYFVPDGFPPLVASVYWWIYAASGSILPQLTSLSVTLQMAATIGLTYKAAKSAFGPVAACISLLVLAASPLLINSVQIGQESGFLALAVAGQICFALAATREPAIAPVVAAALFAALGAQAREYGAALALPAFLLLLRNRETRKLAWNYLLMVAVFSSPWYLRNWFVTGNPLFPHALVGGLPHNRVLVAVLKYYAEFLSSANFTLKQWLEVGYDVILGTMLAIIGLPYMVVTFRSSWAYLVPVVFLTALWIWVIGQTSGGVQYSMRVLVPAIVILSIVGGEACQQYFFRRQSRAHPKVIITVLLFFAGYGVLTALAYPLAPNNITEAIFSTKSNAPEFATSHAELVRQIKTLNSPPTGILTDNSYFAVMLTHETNFKPIMIWNPEVDFLFNADLRGEDAREKLIAMNIKMVAMSKASIHNPFLFRFPFYRDDYQTWAQLLLAEDTFALFELPQKAGQRQQVKGAE